MDPEPRPSGSRTMLATVALEVRCAVALLTRLRAAPAAVDRTGSAWFGLVGAVLGALAGSVTLALGERALLAAALALVVLALASGALHLDGLADTADAFAAPDPANAERARRDPAIGAAGAVVVALVLLVDTAALASLPAGSLLPALVVASSVSRAVPALAAPWAPAAGAGFGAWFAANAGPGGAALAAATSLALTVLVAWIARDPIVVVAWAAGLAGGLAVLAFVAARFGAVTGDGYGAAVEVAFAASLVGGAVVQ